MPGTVRVQVNSQTLAVNFTRSDGSAASVFSDFGMTSAVSLPVTITADTSFYLPAPDTITVSVKSGSAEIASDHGTPLTQVLSQGQVLVIAPTIDLLERSTLDRGTYTPQTKYTSTQPFQDLTLSQNVGTRQLIGIDTTANALYLKDTTNSPLVMSTDNGATWSNHKGWPTGVDQSNAVRIIRFGAYLYLYGGSGTGAVYRALPTPGDTALSWSAAVFTPSAGVTPFPMSLGADDTYLYFCEYGDPTAGPRIWRTSDGTTWTVCRAADSTLRHAHHINPDPYNSGHVYCTVGDGATVALLKSTDHGTTWAALISGGGWNTGQISFDSDWIYLAGDATGLTAARLKRDGSQLTSLASSYHGNLAVPGGASGDLFYTHSYFGCVDPATGIFYSTNGTGSVRGNKFGIFVIPTAGAPVELLNMPNVGAVPNTNDMVYVFGGYMWTAFFKRPLLTL
jgi:hypothetical protein